MCAVFNCSNASLKTFPSSVLTNFSNCCDLTLASILIYPLQKDKENYDKWLCTWKPKTDTLFWSMCNRQLNDQFIWLG